MPLSKPNLLDLPLSILEHVLGFLAVEVKPLDFASALLACRRLRHAGEEVPLSNAKLVITEQKVENGRELLAFLSRKAKSWRHVELWWENAATLQPGITSLLHSLATSAGCGGVQHLHMEFGFNPLYVPQELSALTNLTALKLLQYAGAKPAPASQLSHLAQLSALQELEVTAFVNGPIPPAALSSLQLLTSLAVNFERLQSATHPAAQLTMEHLGACTALRQLRLIDNHLLLSEQEALAAWQQLEHLYIAPAKHMQPAGFWQALPQLPRLTGFELGEASGEPLHAFLGQLPAWSHLQSLNLELYQEPALPQLPTNLTELKLYRADSLQSLPLLPNLRSLELEECHDLTEWPDSLTAMSQLTAIKATYCKLYNMPAPLAALPA